MKGKFWTTHHIRSPDITPSDVHLFRPLKEHLDGKQFVTDGDVQQAVVSWLMAFDPYFFHTRTDSLMSQWDECLSICGNYVEKWCVPKSSYV
jgi:hypothetical protein